MLASHNTGTAIRDGFPGGEFTILLLNFFEDFNEEIIGREQKEEVLW